MVAQQVRTGREEQVIRGVGISSQVDRYMQMPIAKRAPRVGGDAGQNAMLAVAVAADSQGRLLDFRVAYWTL